MIWLLVGITLRALYILILARVVISFVPSWRRTAWGGNIVALTDPVLAPFRAFTLRSGPVGVDFSPLIVLLILSALSRMLPV